jgi:hypothetical protein
VLESVWHHYARAPRAAEPATSTPTATGRSCGTPEVGAPVAGDWPVLEVDTTTGPDVPALARRIVAAAT